MAMLAEGRRKQKFSHDPRNLSWSNDEGKFGHKLMEKMGWSKGKGLGANEDGNVDHVAVNVKNDTRGVGCSKSYVDNWIAHQDDFNALLANLSQDHKSTDDLADSANKVSSLEQTSKSSKGRLHYQKFTKGKDLSVKSASDLDCVFGKRKSQSGTSTPQITSEPNSDIESKDGSVDNPHGIPMVTSTDSVQEYFKKKMAEKMSKLNGTFKPVETIEDTEPVTNDTVNGEINDSGIHSQNDIVMSDETENEPKKKSKKKSKKKKHQMDEPVENIVVEEQEVVEEKVSKKSKKKKRKSVVESEIISECVDETGQTEDAKFTETEETVSKKKSKKKSKSSEPKQDIEAELVDSNKDNETANVTADSETVMEAEEVKKPKKKKKDKKRKRESEEGCEEQTVVPKKKKTVRFSLGAPDDDNNNDDDDDSSGDGVVNGSVGNAEDEKIHLETENCDKSQVESGIENNLADKPKKTGKLPVLYHHAKAFKGSNIGHVSGYAGMPISGYDIKRKLANQRRKWNH